MTVILLLSSYSLQGMHLISLHGSVRGKKKKNKKFLYYDLTDGRIHIITILQMRGWRIRIVLNFPKCPKLAGSKGRGETQTV